MDLICYAAPDCPYETNGMFHLQIEAPIDHLVLCRTLEELTENLLRPLGDVLAVVLFIADVSELHRILTLKDVLHGTRVILVFPEWNPELVAEGHQFRPRFMTSPGPAMEQVNAVLQKMDAVLQGRGTERTRGY